VVEAPQLLEALVRRYAELRGPACEELVRQIVAWRGEDDHRGAIFALLAGPWRHALDTIREIGHGELSFDLLDLQTDVVAALVADPRG
jgi:hypothetical protein